MALPTGISSCSGIVEVSIDGTSWTDYSDQLSVLEPPEQARMTGATNVIGEGAPVVTAGKKEMMELVVRGVFTAVATDAFEIARIQWDTDPCGLLYCVRYSPEGGDTGDFMFTANTVNSRITGFVYPGIDSTSADAATFQLTVLTSELTKSVVA